MQLIELAQWRQLAYRLFSSVLLYPQEARLQAMAATAVELHKQRRAMVKFAFFPQWHRLLTSLADPPDYHALEREYVQLFVHNPKRAPCLPYESEHVDHGGQSAGWIAASLEQEYAAAGLALSPSLKDLPDHVSVELEFMAFLCRQEADAWNREVVNEAVQSLERQAEFLNRHLANWFPRWARQVTTADNGGFYSTVVETVRYFIGHDQDLISTLLNKFRIMPEAVQGEAVSKVTSEEAVTF